MENERDLIAWPDVPRLAFGPGLPGEHNANLAWLQNRPRDMYGYIEGYRRAAAALYDFAVATRSSPEYMLFPIAFAWRHFLEIALKDIIASGRELSGDPWGFHAATNCSTSGAKLGRTSRRLATRRHQSLRTLKTTSASSIVSITPVTDFATRSTAPALFQVSRTRRPT